VNAAPNTATHEATRIACIRARDCEQRRGGDGQGAAEFTCRSTGESRYATAACLSRRHAVLICRCPLTSSLIGNFLSRTAAMRSTVPPAMERSLARMRSEGERVDVSELARKLFCLKLPASGPISRRIVAEALGHPEQALPDLLEARQLRPSVETAVVDTPISTASFAVVDLETTGVALETSAIVEIGAVRVRQLKPTSRFHSMVRPPHPMPPRICALTGIDDSMLVDAPAPGPALSRFRRWLERTPTAPFVAHNASFDSRFVERGLRDEGLSAYPGPVLCTRRLAIRLLPNLERYSLDHLCAQFGVPNAARHRALGDAEATARVLIELLSLAVEKEGLRTLGDLIDLQSRPTRRRSRSRKKSGSGSGPEARAREPR
jgi:DNA polymerase III epsilon subunit family exonuclease